MGAIHGEVKGQTSYEGPGYVRSLAVLGDAPPVFVKNAFDAFADHDNSINIPILDLLVVTSKRKLRTSDEEQEAVQYRRLGLSGQFVMFDSFNYICGSGGPPPF